MRTRDLDVTYEKLREILVRGRVGAVGAKVCQTVIECTMYEPFNVRTVENNVYKIINIFGYGVEFIFWFQPQDTLGMVQIFTIESRKWTTVSDSDWWVNDILDVYVGSRQTL